MSRIPSVPALASRETRRRRGLLAIAYEELVDYIESRIFAIRHSFSLVNTLVGDLVQLAARLLEHVRQLERELATRGIGTFTQAGTVAADDIQMAQERARQGEPMPETVYISLPFSAHARGERYGPVYTQAQDSDL